jgi:hypothetical protein
MKIPQKAATSPLLHRGLPEKAAKLAKPNLICLPLRRGN